MDRRLYGRYPYRAVAIHGGPGAPGSVSTLAIGLSAGMGTMEPFQTATTVMGQVDELAEQIIEVNNDEMFIFGHSWGAWLAYLLAHKYPSLVKKAFLIGSGALDRKYLDEMTGRRLSRLSIKERQEYYRILKHLPGAEDHLKDALLIRLGELAEKSDNYCVEDIPENKESLVTIDGKLYQSIWPEAAKLRDDGYLVSIAREIAKPIRIIHGSNDSTPISAVVEPIKTLMKDLKWYEIEKCGHCPWKEKYGKHSFYQIIESELY